MRSTKFNISVKSTSGWQAAVQLTEAYLSSSQKADQLLDSLPEGFTGVKRASCQSLFLGALRHGHRTQAALTRLRKKTAKARVEAVFLVTGHEILEAEAERYPKVVHHAVEESKRLVSKHEQGFINAVLRKLPYEITSFDPRSQPAAHFSHPRWLVDHWAREFPKNYLDLLRWNQEIPTNYLKVYQKIDPIPEGLQATCWPQFYRIKREASWQNDIRPRLNQGSAYVKDPSTRLAPDLLRPLPGESLLDLCAAPGGKAFDLAHLMQHRGQIVAVDLPGPRIARLRENLATLATEELNPTVLEADVLLLTPEILTQKNLPTSYDGVMLDAPCSNTGVIQRRTDVKWRLQPNNILDCAALQLKLLKAASKFTRPGGRLVYSTCSIENEENQQVVDAFLKSKAGADFTLKERQLSLPWETRHDGAGAFRIERTPR